MIVLFDHESIKEYKLKVNNCFIFDRESKGSDLNFEKIIMLLFNRIS